jgi:diadenosine tetraphosphate (Ap4A) HIT family hydrolase
MESDPLFIADSEHWRMVLNPNQTYLGRAVLLLKRNCGDLAAVSAEEFLDLLQLIKRSQEAYKRALSATMFNWSCLMNNAYQETPPRPHVHWHLVPRYKSPATFAGKEFPDPNFGHRSVEDVVSLPDDVLSALVTHLQKAMRDAQL